MSCRESQRYGPGRHGQLRFGSGDHLSEAARSVGKSVGRTGGSGEKEERLKREGNAREGLWRRIGHRYPEVDSHSLGEDDSGRVG